MAFFGLLTLRGALLGVAIGAAASAPIFFQTPAQAACTTVGSGIGQNCTVFDPTSSTNLEGFGYTDAAFVQNNVIENIRFGTQDGASDLVFTPTPITITGIAYSIDNGSNWLTGGINTSISLPSGGLSSNILSGSPINTGPAWGSNFRVRFTVPTLTTSNGAQLSVRVTSNGAGSLNTQTRLFTSTVTPSTGTPIPGPLPILGAGTAFGFSRTLRKRIKAADQA